jgi:hypothetical protein
MQYDKDATRGNDGCLLDDGRGLRAEFVLEFYNDPIDDAPGFSAVVGFNRDQ